MARPRVLLFDVMADGHGVKNWTALLASPAFRDLTANGECDLKILIPDLLRDRLQPAVAGKVDLSCFCLDAPVGLEDFRTSAGRRRAIGSLLSTIRDGRFDAALVLYADALVSYFPLLLAVRPHCRVGAVVFRPIIHYRACGYVMGEASRAQYVRPLLKNGLLLLLLKSGLLSLAIFQDDDCVQWFLQRGTRALWLPTPPVSSITDPVVPSPAGRVRFTLFGSISRRKGVFKILEVWRMLPAELRAEVQLRLVGRIDEEDRDAVYAATAQMGEDEIYLDNRFVANDEIRGVYEHTDVMLLPYSGLHVGTSGILVQCAMWGVPAMVENLGWVGAQTERLGLGTVVRFADTQAVSEAIHRYVHAADHREVSTDGFQFARNHLPDIYGRQIATAVRQLATCTVADAARP